MLSAAIRKKVRREPPKAQRSRDRPADRIGFAFRSGRQSNPECLLAFGRFPIIDKSLLSVLPPEVHWIHTATDSPLLDPAVLWKSQSLDREWRAQQMLPMLKAIKKHRISLSANFMNYSIVVCAKRKKRPQI